MSPTPTPPPPPPGSTSLPHLLASLSPTLHPTPFIFLTFPPSPSPLPPAPLLSSAILTFREPEGLTLITPLSAIPSSSSENNNSNNIPAPYQMAYRSRMITCNVHSSLSAVGFLAAITGRLAERGISMNPISGFFHDHLFVEEGREGEAMEALWGLAAEAKGRREGEGIVDG